MASKGYRVLGMAYKDGDTLEQLNEISHSDDRESEEFKYMANEKNLAKIESNLTFLGLTIIKDPVKPEAYESIQLAYKAGITVFMITGDFPNTAFAVSKELGLVSKDASIENQDDKKLYIGKEINDMKSSELSKILKNAIKRKESLIFARAQPTCKRKIVKAISGLHEIVAMTGDGVNDAPALKQASIGIAMGIQGTDVAKEASDMILLDDNFATIVAAIEEGRSIYSNMKAFIRYMISSNIGEVISIFITSLMGIPEGFNSIQLLWVNLVTDGLPATALSFNNPDPDVMVRPPRKRDDKIVDSWIFTRYMIIGTYVGVATVGIFVYYYCYYSWADHAHSIISLSQLRNWAHCTNWKDNFIGFEGNPCEYFLNGKKKASTLSLTVLVMIEMWNALNAMS